MSVLVHRTHPRRNALLANQDHLSQMNVSRRMSPGLALDSPREWTADLIREAQLFAGRIPKPWEVTEVTLDALLRPITALVVQAAVPWQFLLARGVISEMLVRTAQQCGRLELMIPMLKGQYPDCPLALAAWLRQGLALIFTDGERNLDLINVKHYLDQHPDERLSVNVIARRTGRSVSSLNAEFRLMFGASVYEYWKEVRLRRAVALLASSGLKVDAIASMTGYRSKKNLYSAIRESFGVTPAQLRARFRIETGMQRRQLP